MGLYGNIVVEPAGADYWPTSDRDVVLAIDDFLLEEGRQRCTTERHLITWPWGGSATCSS